MDIIEKFRKEAFRRRLRPKTIKTYLFYIRKFLVFTKKDTKSLTKKDVKSYLHHLSQRQLAGKTINVAFMAILFLTREVLNKDWKIRYRCSRTVKTLPIVLTKKEVQQLLHAIENEKHKLMITLLYSAGLRVGELVALKVGHLEGTYGWVRNGKFGKDRMFIIAASLRDCLQVWIERMGLGIADYLFSGQKTHYTARSIQAIISKAAKRAGIAKKVHPHTLRHSFATHIIENGYDVATVQGLLGHSSAETSMMYVHAAAPNMISVKSPLDSL